jgi:hypothetical protein
LALISFVLVTPAAAFAQGTDEGAAESLFRTGKALLEQKDYAQACPKLAESYRLDPGTGTLLALALCHEGEGRLATAWAEFAEVVVRARRDHRSDREDLAHQHQTALEARLPMLTISVVPGAEKIEHLTIKRDGVEVGTGSWSTPIPVDPGHHNVEATAPGYKPFVTVVTVSGDGDRQSVIIQILQPEPVEEAKASGGGDEGKALRYAGFATLGAGVIGLGLGTAFGLRAMSLNNDSKSGCDAQSNCDPAGFSSRTDARTAGNVSTASFIAGGALLAAGAVMVVVARPRSGRIGSWRSWRAGPLLGGGDVGVQVGGAF